MFTTQIARSGELTLLINGKSVHSLYNPSKEADSFLIKQSFKNIPQIFILIGPGLGYLKKSVQKLYPNSYILSLHLDKWIFEHTIKIGDNWFYNDKTNLRRKLSLVISDFLLSNTTVIKWLPCTNNFPERTKDIENIIQQFFQERKGTIFTTKYFGRKWLRNTYYNFLEIDKIVKFNNIDLPILVAASGPSLKDSINIIKDYRESFILAALSSSLSALNNANIKPDFIFHTDPGFWAKEHLKHIPETNIPVIMPLTASFLSNIKNPVIYFNQGSFIEELLLKNTFLQVPSHGTVAGTAYQFLRKITDNPIIFMGLDFCFNDIMEHVTPHSFDIIYNIRQNRLDGYLNILYKKRQAHIKNPLSTYSGWFNNKTQLTNAYRYNPTNISTNGLVTINFKQIISFFYKSSQTKNTVLFTEETNSYFNKSNLTETLQHIISLLEKFKLEIPSMTSEKIFNFFVNPNHLSEVFQYTAYSDILILSHYYRDDLNKSQKLLNKIYSEANEFILGLLERSNYE